MKRTLIGLAMLALVGCSNGPGTGSITPDRHEQQPYGGCDEAWQAPYSEGADWCRDHGWTIAHPVDARDLCRAYATMKHQRLTTLEWLRLAEQAGRTDDADLGRDLERAINAYLNGNADLLVRSDRAVRADCQRLEVAS